MTRLSVAQLATLRRAQRTLLSPLDHEREEDWCLAVVRAAKDFLGLNLGCLALAADGAPTFVTEDFDPDLFSAMRATGVSGGVIETADSTITAAQRYAARERVHAYEAGAMYRRANGVRFEDTAFYQEFVEPVGVVDPISVQASLPIGGAMLALGRVRGTRQLSSVPEQLHLAEFIFPALEAGTRLLLELSPRRGMLAGMLDRLGIAVVVYSSAGSELVRNVAMGHLLRLEPDPERLMQQVRSFAQRILPLLDGRAPVDVAGAAGTHRVRTGAASYLLRGAFLPAGSFGGLPAIWVTVQPAQARLPPVELLRERFGLTAREAEVALLLARGGTNKAIARELGIRPATVRTHSEHLFPKLGVSSRKALGLALLELAERGGMPGS